LSRQPAWREAITMYSGTSRLEIPVVLLLLALAFGGCGNDVREETAGSRKGTAAGESARDEHEPLPGAVAITDTGKPAPQRPATLPRLVDLGKGTCIPCKMMAPILEELKGEYEGRAVVEVIDLRENGRAAADYQVRVIPTQIFFDANGEEVWRHEGFLPKDQIIAKLSELGVPPLHD
jgi:thioredoxin 1